MKERNLYKDIVVGAFILALVVVCSNLWKKYLREQETYSFSIQSDQEITEHTAGQLQNITGLCRFVHDLPFTRCNLFLCHTVSFLSIYIVNLYIGQLSLIIKSR